MSAAKRLGNIARLMTSCNFGIKQLPDNLKCALCKLVLKDACQLPCGCRFCCACIDDLMARGGEFCPGESEDCGETALSTAAPDYSANRSVSGLVAKCPHNGCVHECQLANMEEHFRECPRRSEECPFRELGCTQDKLAAEEMGGHLQQDSRRHSEILIGMVANVNREIKTLKHNLELKDGRIRSIMDQLIHLENENKSIAREKAELVDRVAVLSKQIERRENDELDSASRVIEQLDREISAVRRVIGSNKAELDTEMRSVTDDIYAIQTLLGLGQVDARCVWLIDDDVGKTQWVGGDRFSDCFHGAVHSYRYRLASWNGPDSLEIWLLVYHGPSDGQLAWPFQARVAITMADRNRPEARISTSLQCRIERPPDAGCRGNEHFVFPHSELISAGIDLARGARVSCLIVPGAGR